MDLQARVLNNEATINRLEVELSSLKERVSFFSMIYTKFDATLGKLQEMIENRRFENNEEIKDVYIRLEASEQRILGEMKDMRDEMKNNHQAYQTKIAEIDKWRWIVVGAAGVVGWLLNKFFGIST